MRLRLKEEPKEWRKAAWLGAGGLTVLSTVLRWRRVLPSPAWLALLAALAIVATCAGLRPGWFRAYYRITARVGFALTQVIGHVLLATLFVLVVTPLGWMIRRLGKDPLQLKPQRDARTFWQPARPSTPLERLF